MPDQHCQNCGESILVMIRKNTGFCSERCEDKWQAKWGNMIACPYDNCEFRGEEVEVYDHLREVHESKG